MKSLAIVALVVFGSVAYADQAADIAAQSARIRDAQHEVHVETKNLYLVADKWVEQLSSTDPAVIRTAQQQLRQIPRTLHAMVDFDGALSEAIGTRSPPHQAAVLKSAAPATASYDEMLVSVKKATADAKAKLDAIRTRGDNISIVEMFEMQMLMNKLSQLSEMSTGVMSASNAAISSLARNVKQ
jgi:hypothetical protein